MYKALLFALLLPMCCNAQKLELSFGHGIVSYKTMVGRSGSIWQNPHFIMKVMYNIAEQVQVGINFQGAERTQAVDAFFNWSPKGANTDPVKLYLGANVGYISYREENNYRTEYAEGAAMKGGIQIGIATPPTSRVGFYAETGFNYCAGHGRIGRWSTHSSSSFVYPNSSATITYIPLNLGVRFRFLYKKDKQATD